jgi:hypothetical protein
MDIIKSPCSRQIAIKLPFVLDTVSLNLQLCHLVFAMRRQHFKGLWTRYYLIYWISACWYTWMTFLYTPQISSSISMIWIKCSLYLINIIKAKRKQVLTISWVCRVFGSCNKCQRYWSWVGKGWSCWKVANS